MVKKLLIKLNSSHSKINYLNRSRKPKETLQKQKVKKCIKKTFKYHHHPKITLIRTPNQENYLSFNYRQFSLLGYLYLFFFLFFLYFYFFFFFTLFLSDFFKYRIIFTIYYLLFHIFYF
jgi:hypothetical protein